MNSLKMYPEAFSFHTVRTILRRFSFRRSNFRIKSSIICFLPGLYNWRCLFTWAFKVEKQTDLWRRLTAVIWSSPTGYSFGTPQADQYAPQVPPPPTTPGTATLGFAPATTPTQDLSKAPTGQPDFPYSQYGKKILKEGRKCPARFLSLFDLLLFF